MKGGPLSVVLPCRWLRGLCALMSLRAMPAGALAPGRVPQAGQGSRGGARLKGLPDPLG